MSSRSTDGPQHRASPTLRLLIAASAIPDRVFKLLERAFRVYVMLRSELVVALVPPERWNDYTVGRYARNRLYLSRRHNDMLFGWEKRIIESFFPAPPARVLVTATGGGREMRQLAELGYAVAGFDPVPALAAHAEAIVDAQHRLGCVVASYEDLVRGLPEIERFAPYDAVVVGCGSIGHVGVRETRRATIERLAELCPNGPMLVSWIPFGGGFEWAQPGPRRRRLRQVLARLFGSRRAAAGDAFRLDFGFLHVLDHDEIAELAREAGCTVVRCDDVGVFPHAVLRRIDGAASASHGSGGRP